jgi:SH3-like domain-containing protein
LTRLICALAPGREYPVLWQYRQAGLPLLVDAEFGIWRKVIDHDGTAGWMHGSVLSLRRMALVQKNMAKIHANPDETSNVIALAERLALMELQSCPKAWCRVANNDVRGWIKRQAVWGTSRNRKPRLGFISSKKTAPHFTGMPQLFMPVKDRSF